MVLLVHVNEGAFMGVSLGGKVFSPPLVVYLNEVIKQARLFARGFVFDDAVLALGEIAEAGPGGNFLTSELTERGEAFIERYKVHGLKKRSSRGSRLRASS